MPPPMPAFARLFTAMPRVEATPAFWSSSGTGRGGGGREGAGSSRSGGPSRPCSSRQVFWVFISRRRAWRRCDSRRSPT